MTLLFPPATVATVPAASFADPPAWHALERAKVAAALDVPLTGLRDREAPERLERYGPNRIGLERSGRTGGAAMFGSILIRADD